MSPAITACSPERFRLATFRAGAMLRARLVPLQRPALPTQLSGLPHQSQWETYPVTIAIHLTIAVYAFTWIALRNHPPTLWLGPIAAACLVFAPIVPSFTVVFFGSCITLAGVVVPPLRRIDAQRIQNAIHWILLLVASWHVAHQPLLTRWIGWFWLAAAAFNAVVSVVLAFVKPRAGGAASAA